MTKDERDAVKAWQRRHEWSGPNPPYFEGSPVHAGWHVNDAPYHWFIHLVKPTKDDVVLDLGCGYGEWMIPHAPLVRWISGVDIHVSLITVANRKFLEHGVVNADVRLGDGVTIPWPDESFTVVQSNAIFYHTPHCITLRYLPETFRVLKEGGRMVHLFLKEGWPGCPPDIGLDRDGNWSAAWSKQDLLNLGRFAGFKGPEVVDVCDAFALTGVKE